MNILFAIADDASHFSAYGHSFVRTPNFDRVAENGVLFENMFTTNPKCAPSRASILTGMHTWQLKEACTHWCVFPGKDEFTVFPDILEEAGYHVGFTGKGWGPGDYERRGRTRNPAGKAYNEKTLTPPDASKISSNDYAANFRVFLDSRPEGAPFYFWYGAFEPHRPYTPGEGAAHGKNSKEIDQVPPYWPDEEIVRQDMLDYAFEVEWFDRHLGSMLDILEEHGELENTLVVVTSDNGAPFPRVKGQMYEYDFRLPFAAMCPGTLKGGRRVGDISSFVDIMPTFLEAAGIDIPEELPGKSLYDILLSDNSGTVTLSRNRAFMGRERHDLGMVNDKGYPVRCIRTPEYLLVKNYDPDCWPAGHPDTGFPGCDNSPTKKRILDMHAHGEDKFFELCFGKRPGIELYKIKDDPHCLENLALKEEYSELADDLESELEAFLEKTGDPRQRGEGDIFNTYEYVGHDTASHSWKALQEGCWEPQKH